MAAAVGLVEDPSRGLGLPLHVRGTAFQLKVWEALRGIGPGRTATYKEVAAKAGVPRAVRAVGRAIASNKIAVAIPCHRVICTGGALRATAGASSERPHCSRANVAVNASLSRAACRPRRECPGGFMTANLGS